MRTVVKSTDLALVLGTLFVAPASAEAIVERVVPTRVTLADKSWSEGRLEQKSDYTADLYDEAGALLDTLQFIEKQRTSLNTPASVTIFRGKKYNAIVRDELNIASALNVEHPVRLPQLEKENSGRCP